MWSKVRRRLSVKQPGRVHQIFLQNAEDGFLQVAEPPVVDSNANQTQHKRIHDWRASLSSLLSWRRPAQTAMDSVCSLAESHSTLRDVATVNNDAVHSVESISVAREDRIQPRFSQRVWMIGDSDSEESEMQPRRRSSLYQSDFRNDALYYPSNFRSSRRKAIHSLCVESSTASRVRTLTDHGHIRSSPRTLDSDLWRKLARNRTVIQTDSEDEDEYHDSMRDLHTRTPVTLNEILEASRASSTLERESTYNTPSSHTLDSQPHHCGTSAVTKWSEAVACTQIERSASLVRRPCSHSCLSLRFVSDALQQSSLVRRSSTQIRPRTLLCHDRLASV